MLRYLHLVLETAQYYDEVWIFKSARKNSAGVLVPRVRPRFSQPLLPASK